jgi:formyl-CoA transferase
MPLLSDLTVLALEQATALPFLTQRLARDGARVIRVEAPERGDPNRYVGQAAPGEAGMATYYLPNNCGKQAITLNLAQPEGQALLRALIERLPVDIFATNNRPSSYARLGIDYQRLRAVHPGLIWLGITGYGPECDEPAYDPVLQARLGWMALTGEPEGDPQIFGLPMVDLGAAEHAYAALMKALYRRARTGEGSRVDISMFHSAAAWMGTPLALTGLGETITRRGNTHQFFAPASVYPAADGFVYIAVGNDRQWAALTRLPEFETLADPAYTENAGRIADVARLNRQLAALTRRLAAERIRQRLSGIGVPVAPVNTLAQVLAEPLLAQAGATARDAATGRVVSLPPGPEVSDPGLGTLAFPPRLGEHNAEIYGALGYAPDALAALRQRGVI